VSRNPLTGMNVAITGGARGIGRATALAFASAGAKVAVGDVDVDDAERFAADSDGVVGLPLDVRSAESFAAFLDDAERAHGPLDVLVNNAGVMLTGEFVEETDAAAATMIEINLMGVVIGCRLASRRFVARGGGTIVNVASMAGIAGFPGVATYCATKFGVVGLTRALREELAPTGVTVSAVLPGIVHTELSAGIEVPGVVERFVSVEPSDIAATVVDVVRRDRAVACVPRRLSPLLRAAYAVPERPRRALARLSRVDRAYLAVDQATRDSYHSRAMG
jgi:NAD(P)-dependent dehydrogenase (short-subunit alcohol dehydrogenase family)